LYSDPGITGTVEKRPALNRLREDARAGKFDILYFWKSDRLARDEIIQLSLYREFEQLGIETFSVSEPFMNRLMRGIYAVFGAEDLRNIKAKMYSGRIQAMKHGKWIGAPPYGYRKDERFKLVADEPEAQWVKQIFTWFVEDRLSLKALVRRLHQRGVPTRWDLGGRVKPQNGRGFWSSGALGRLLKREYYASGEAIRTFRPELGLRDTSAKQAIEEVRIDVPQIVSLELFQRAQEQLRHNHEYARRRAKRLYLFAKKLICGVCGLKLTGSCRPEREGLNYYRNNRLARDRECFNCRYYSEYSLDAVIWPRIVSLFQNPEVFIAELELYRRKDDGVANLLAERRELANSETDLVEQEKSLLRLELEQFYHQDVLEEKRRELQGQRTAVAERRRVLEGRIRAAQDRLATVTSARQLYQALQTALERPTHVTKAQVYQLLIEKIILNGDSAEVWVNISDGRSVDDDGVDEAHDASQSQPLAAFSGMNDRTETYSLRKPRPTSPNPEATGVCNALHTPEESQTVPNGLCGADRACSGPESDTVRHSRLALIVFPATLTRRVAKTA
jgi:site-specific DNA recombinase